MDLMELRVLFAAGLLVLGGLAAVLGMLLAGLAERLGSRRGSAAAAGANRIRTQAARRGVVGHAGP